MAITYTWSINQLTAYPTYESQTDVVFKVTWSYRGKDANGVGSSRGGVTEVTYAAGASFTPFNQLTEAQVLGWVTPTITPEQMTEMEAGINGDISWQIAQASANDPITPPLPWPANTPEPAAAPAPTGPVASSVSDSSTSVAPTGPTA